MPTNNVKILFISRELTFITGYRNKRKEKNMSTGKPKTARASSITVDPDATFVLGIDIGTTSVKACIVDTATKTIAAIQAKDTQGNLPLLINAKKTKELSFILIL